MLNTEKKDYTYFFITKCLTILSKNYLALMLIFLIIALNTLLLLATLFVEYKYVGIHIFDFNSLTALLHTDFWAHILNIISLFCLFSLGIIITTFFKFSLTLVFMKTLQNQKITLLQSLSLPFNRIKEIIRFSFIRVFDYPEYWYSVIDPVEQSKRIKKLLQKEDFLEDEYSEYSSPKQMLILPLLVDTTIDTAHMLQESETLIHSTFGDITKYNYSCNKIRTFITCIIVPSAFIIINFILKFNVFFTLFIALYFTILLFHILGNIKLLFNTIVYNYCTSNNLQEFKSEELKNMFS